MSEFKTWLTAQIEIVDSALDRQLPTEGTAPETIHKAMRYSIFAGGKRLRPVMTLAAAEACADAILEGELLENVLLPACAVEMMHTYSLIHDDLPCMDDDDLRRGRPTSHKVFGEGVAVLAGDALLTQCFEVLAKMRPAGDFSCADYVRELAVTGGSVQLIGGQILDLQGEGQALPLEQLQQVHLAKTAALLTTSLRLGAMAVGAQAAQLEMLTSFGRNLGLAFQVIDDILDVTQTSEQLGKTAGKDEAVEKSTYPSLLGLEASRAEAKRLTEQALSALNTFGDKATQLRAIADYLLNREY